jgi:hypothetical protein
MNKRLIAKGVFSIIIALILLIVRDLLIMAALNDPLTMITTSPISFIIAGSLYTYAAYGIGVIGLVLLLAGIFSSRSGSYKPPQ